MSVCLKYVDPDLLEATKVASETDYCVKTPLSVVAYDSAVVYPGVTNVGGGVVDAGGRYVAHTSVYDGMGQEGSYPTDILDDDSEVVYLGMFYSCWGHCLTDCLQHLWFLNSQNVSAGIKKLKFVYCRTDWGGEMGANFKKMVELLGFDWNQVVKVEKPTRFRRVHVPDSCYCRLGASRDDRYTPEFSVMIETIINRGLNGITPSAPSRNVYFSRSGIHDYRDVTNNEKVIEDVFKGLGYEIFRPETLDLVQMLKLLAVTKSFAASDGSCAHNSVFLPKCSESIVVRKAKYVNATQALIDHLRNLNACYIDANLSNLLFDKRYPMCGPFFVYRNKRFASFANGKSHFPLLGYLIYCSYYFNRVHIHKVRFFGVRLLRKFGLHQ